MFGLDEIDEGFAFGKAGAILKQANRDGDRVLLVFRPLDGDECVICLSVDGFGDREIPKHDNVRFLVAKLLQHDVRRCSYASSVAQNFFEQKRLQFNFGIVALQGDVISLEGRLGQLRQRVVIRCDCHSQRPVKRCKIGQGKNREIVFLTKNHYGRCISETGCRVDGSVLEQPFDEREVDREQKITTDRIGC